MEEASDKFRKALEDKEAEMKSKLNDAIAKEKKILIAKQKMEIENLRQQHEKEIEV